MHGSESGYSDSGSGSNSIDGGKGDDTITVSAVVSGDGNAYAMSGSNTGSTSNSIDGGGGNDHITIIGHVDTSGNSTNVIKGGTGGVEEGVEERDILHIDQNNMADILALSSEGKNSAEGGHISGFEELLLDMTGGGELTDDLLGKLTGDTLKGLTEINNDRDENVLVIKVNDDASAKLIARVEQLGYGTDTASPYTDDADAQAVYIRIINDSGGAG
jgi:hypothetical protein